MAYNPAGRPGRFSPSNPAPAYRTQGQPNIPANYTNPDPFSLARQVGNVQNQGSLDFQNALNQQGIAPQLQIQNQQGVPDYGTGQFQGFTQVPGGGGGAPGGGSQIPGGSLMPDIPDYLGQAGDLFNNFQPNDIGNTPDFSNMFSHYQDMYNNIGPQIPVNDVVSGQQQNQMLNSAIGANAAQRQTGMRDARRDMGARGFTSESPAMQATSNRLGLNEALANTQARVDIPIQAAQQNAQHRLQAMQANQGQRAQDIQNFIGLENAQTNRISPLLSALVGLV